MTTHCMSASVVSSGIDHTNGGVDAARAESQNVRRRRRGSREPLEEIGPLLEMTVPEEPVAHALTSGDTHAHREGPVGEHRAHGCGIFAEIERVDERPGPTVDDLVDDAADRASDDGPFLP